jgi:uncharacterized membrane protein YbhN (UPF0104 family)
MAEDGPQNQAPPGLRVEVEEPTSPRGSRLRGVLSLLLQIACIAYVGRVLWKERTELSAALELSAAAIAGLLVLNGIAHLQRAFEFTYMLRRLDVKEPFWEGFLLTGAGFLLNHLPFNAGLVMRAAVLKRDHALPYTSYLALVMVNAFVNMAMGGAIGLSAVYSSAASGAATLPLALAFLALLLGAIAAVFVPVGWIPSGDWFVWRRLRKLLSGIGLVRGGPRNLALLATLAFTKVVVSGLRMVICFQVLHTELTPLAAALLSSTTIVFSLLNLTPGNLGLREVAMAAVSTLLGASYEVGIAAASIDRAVLLVYTVISGLPGLYSLRRRGPFKGAVG